MSLVLRTKAAWSGSGTSNSRCAAISGSSQASGSRSTAPSETLQEVICRAHPRARGSTPLSSRTPTSSGMSSAAFRAADSRDEAARSFASVTTRPAAERNSRRRSRPAPQSRSRGRHCLFAACPRGIGDGTEAYRPVESAPNHHADLSPRSNPGAGSVAVKFNLRQPSSPAGTWTTSMASSGAVNRRRRRHGLLEPGNTGFQHLLLRRVSVVSRCQRGVARLLPISSAERPGGRATSLTANRTLSAFRLCLRRWFARHLDRDLATAAPLSSLSRCSL